MILLKAATALRGIGFPVDTLARKEPATPRAKLPQSELHKGSASARILWCIVLELGEIQDMAQRKMTKEKRKIDRQSGRLDFLIIVLNTRLNLFKKMTRENEGEESRCREESNPTSLTIFQLKK